MKHIFSESLGKDLLKRTGFRSRDDDVIDLLIDLCKNLETSNGNRAKSFYRPEMKRIFSESLGEDLSKRIGFGTRDDDVIELSINQCFH